MSKGRTKIRKKKSILKVPVLNDEYFVYILWGNAESARNWINLYYGESFTTELFEGFRGRTFYHKGLYPVIFLNTDEHKWATLAHEAVHAIDYIWEDIDETYKGEVYAHCVGAIVWALERLK